MQQPQQQSAGRSSASPVGSVNSANPQSFPAQASPVYPLPPQQQYSQQQPYMQQQHYTQPHMQQQHYTQPHMQQQQYHHPSHGVPPGFEAGERDFLQTAYPAAQIGLQFGTQALTAGQEYVHRNIDRYIPLTVLKTYFNVTNRYVLHKLGLIFFPFRNRAWQRQLAVGGQTDSYKPPREDTNSPDLYIPSMAIVTYVLLTGFLAGLRKSFHPDVLGTMATRSMIFVVIELLLVKLGCQILSIGSEVHTLDILAIIGYNFVGLITTLIADLLLGHYGKYIAFFYVSLAMGFFSVSLALADMTGIVMNGHFQRLAAEPEIKRMRFSRDLHPSEKRRTLDTDDDDDDLCKKKIKLAKDEEPSEHGKLNSISENMSLVLYSPYTALATRLELGYDKIHSNDKVIHNDMKDHTRPDPTGRELVIYEANTIRDNALSAVAAASDQMASDQMDLDQMDLD